MFIYFFIIIYYLYTCLFIGDISRRGGKNQLKYPSKGIQHLKLANTLKKKKREVHLIQS
jgi:hypothetical protein